MAIKIVGLIIGILILGVGVYYLAKEITDKESKKIYTITSVVGGSHRRDLRCAAVSLT